MAKKSRSPVESFWYVLPADQKLPLGEQSRFKFRPLNQAERMKALDNIESVTIEATGEKQLRFRSFQQARDTVIATLIDTENFPDEGSAPFPVSGTREERERYIADIDDNDLYALGDYVFDRSTIGDTEKNSLTP